MTRCGRILLLAAAAMAAGCGGAGQPPPAAQPYRDPGFVIEGGLRLHYALTPTLDLPPEIAGSYGIKRRRNLALLTIALAATEGGAPGASVEAQTISLLGERRPLPMRVVDEATAPSYIAVIELRHREPVTIEAMARTGDGRTMRARFTREFHLD